MKLPKGIPNDVVLWTWMAHRKSNDSELNSRSFVSPILKENTNGVHPHVVTLSLRPFRTTNLSVDSFIASHSPRRNNNSKQKFTLKPLSLDQRSCSSNIHTFGKETLDQSVTSSSQEHERISYGRSDITADRPCSNYSINQRRVGKPSASVSNCSDVDSNFSSKQYRVPDSLYTIHNNSFRPPPRISHLTGQNMTLGKTFANGYNYHAGYINLLPTQNDLVATGTPVSTIGPKQIQATKPVPRWQTAKSALKEQGSKYPDPMVGCIPGFQARMSEITQHELDTVKWEKAKKSKKKSSSS